MSASGAGDSLVLRPIDAARLCAFKPARGRSVIGSYAPVAVGRLADLSGVRALQPPVHPRPTLSGSKARRLGLHHVAYLRAVAGGVAMGAAAQRNLGSIEHRAVIALARAIARRRGDPR